jgi:hypothetical protein
MNTTAGLSSCLMTPAPASGEMQNMLRLADHCPQCQPFGVSDFCVSAKAVEPPARAENPMSITSARSHREQAWRRPSRRAA